MPDIVLFGATGYTGRLTGRAMVERGLRPVLAGRNRAALERLASALGGLAVRIADVADPASVRRALGERDVLVSTVGPFARYGRVALDAAIAARAHYIDSTGEPAFVREVFERNDARARAAGCALLTAFGYDYVPGNTAAAAALAKAGAEAVRVDVGYFVAEGRGLDMSEGTRASLLGALIEPGIFFNDGHRRVDYAGMQVRDFRLGSTQRASAISVPGSECLALPASFPGLRDVNVYLGWFGKLSPLVSRLSRLQSRLLALPRYRQALSWAVGRVGSKGAGPDEATRAASGSHIVAIAHDASGRVLATAELVGVNGYTYTANMLAWGAGQAHAGRLLDRGALGPVAAFGLDAMVAGNREAGLELTVR